MPSREALQPMETPKQRLTHEAELMPRPALAMSRGQELSEDPYFRVYTLYTYIHVYDVYIHIYTESDR